MPHTKVLSAATLLLSTLALSATACAAVPFAKASIQARVAADQTVSFDVYLPVQHRADLEQLLTSLNTPGSPNYQHWLTPEQFHQRFNATDADVAGIQRDLAASGLTSTLVDAQHLEVTGAAGVVERVFGTELHNAIRPDGQSHIAAVTRPLLPASLSRLNAIPVGFSADIRMHSNAVRQAAPNNRYSPVGPYWFTDLKQAYQFPSYKIFTGKGSHIAVLMSGGYSQADMDQYFGHEKLTGNKAPDFKEIDIKGGLPFSADNSFETELDLQQTGGMAPDAKITLYNVPDLSDRNILRGLKRIVERNKDDVVNMSFGGAELLYTAAYNGGVDFTDILQMEDDVFAQGNAQGITFVASSGDSGGLAVPALPCLLKGATAGCGSYVPSVNFPASSPHVTGVGGTNLTTTSSTTNLASKYVSEQAFADPLEADIFYGTPATGGVWGSGGGDSVLFAKPDWQFLVKTGNARYRTVPDVAGHEGGCPGGALTCSDSDSADLEVLGGEYVGVIGTSASSPDFAGLIALAVQRYGTRLGNANPFLYALSAAQKAGLVQGVYNWNIPGNNGVFSSGNAGYNRVLGNGTVNGAALLLEPGLPIAGNPQTPSNP